MIRLDVQPYCSECCDFEPDVTKPVKICSGDRVVAKTDTIIRCDHWKRCEAIRRYLEQQRSNK